MNHKNSKCIFFHTGMVLNESCDKIVANCFCDLDEMEEDKPCTSDACIYYTLVKKARRPMASETQLKRCPFCGREAKVGEYNHGKWFVECRNPWCFASFNGHTFVSKQTAIAAWNRRVSNGK